MNKFDKMIKEMAKKEEISLPPGFNDRIDYLINQHTKNINHTVKTTGFKLLRYKTAVVLLCAILLFGSVTVAAEYISGGDFFISFFNNKRNNNENIDYSYMNTEQLNEMSSSTIGTVVDTDELTIEIMGVVISGNTAKVMIKVTANDLNSVLYDNGVLPLKNYRFYEEVSSLDEGLAGGSIDYYYNDRNTSLKHNQFEIMFTFIGNNAFGNGKHTIKLNKFGYYSSDLEFKAIYNDTWQFEFAFDAETDYSKELYINQITNIDNNEFCLNSIKITPFALTISFKAYTEFTNDLYKMYSKEIPEIIIKLKDGTIIGRDQYSYTCGADEETNIYGAVIDFAVPITVNDVRSINIFGDEYVIE